MRGIFWPENEKVGREFHFALAVPGRLVNVGDDLIVRIVRVDSEIDFASEFFVRANRAERFSAKHVLTAGNFNPRNFRARHCRRESRNNRH